MSEFSASWHCLDIKTAELENVLRAAGVDLVLLNRRGKLRSFVVSRDDDARIPRLLRGPLVHYDFAEDHGVEVELFFEGARRSRIKASFETSRGKDFDPKSWVSLRLLRPTDVKRVRAYVACSHDFAARSAFGEYFLAETLGLPVFAWTDYEHFGRDRAPSLSAAPMTREVWTPRTPNVEADAFCLLLAIDKECLKSPGTIPHLLESAVSNDEEGPTATALDLGKRWPSLHRRLVKLSRTTKSAALACAVVGIDSQKVGSPMASGPGPARYLLPAQVKAVSKALQTLKVKAADRHLVWLQQFYRDAERAKKAVLQAVY